MAILYFDILSTKRFCPEIFDDSFSRLGPNFFLSSSGCYKKKEKKLKALQSSCFSKQSYLIGQPFCETLFINIFGDFFKILFSTDAILKGALY